MRATWPEDTITAREFLALARARGARWSMAELDAIEASELLNAPPEDKRAGR